MSVGENRLRIGAYVLAGGGSTRFGSDKALAELGGRPMLARMLGVVDYAASLEELACKALVIGAAQKYGAVWTVCVEDRWPGEGPLGGIVTALLYTRENKPECEWNLIVSCDMPFLVVDWMKYLARRAAESSADVVLAHSVHGPEPLCACYRTGAAQPLRAVFDLGVRKVTQALKQVATEVLDERDWKRFDSAGRLFWNMNTAADYDEARRIFLGGQIDGSRG